MKVVIVGNGVAGIEAALAIRRREPSWEIAIVSEESDHFFSRTALMWVHSGQMSQRDIEPYERDLYARSGFRRVRDRAIGIDENAIELASGESIEFGRLLIASGSKPRPAPWPGSDLRGVGHFVTLQDLEWFEREVHGESASRPVNAEAHLRSTRDDSPYRIREAASSKRGRLAERAVVIGGGLIGIEAVEVLLAAKRKVSFVVRDEWFWPMAIDARESAFVCDRLREHGVDVRLSENVERFEGDGTLAKVVTNEGEIDADCAVVAIGVVPNTEWLKESDLEVGDEGAGIVVDDALRTSRDDVFAAGDCALVRWFDGSRRPEQLWYTARDQGRVAARSMLGDDAKYTRGIWYNSAKLMDFEYTTVGFVNVNIEGEKNWYFEEKGAVRSTTRITIAPDAQGKERVVGFNLLGRRWDHEVLIGWIAERRSLAYVLDRLRDASFDTELVPRLSIPKNIELDGPAPSSTEAPVPYPLR
jgi:NADPH-dependent 2,4-dienoyl-CoA reductase/sulfur reductase-like enzyme